MAQTKKRTKKKNKNHK